MSFIKTHKKLFSALFIVALFSVAGLIWGKSLNPSGLTGNLININTRTISKVQESKVQPIATKPNVGTVRSQPADPCQNKCSSAESCVQLECGTNEFACAPKAGKPLNGDAECAKRGYAAPVQGDLSRAALAKMLIVSIDGLTKCKRPNTPTFTDVQPGTWYYDYVECAVQLGIMAGYTDASVNSTSKFGPTDSVVRAQAIKIIVSALSVKPAQAGLVLPFTDVTATAWYYNSVAAAYQGGLIRDSVDHLFRPSDWAMTAWVEEVLSRK